MDTIRVEAARFAQAVNIDGTYETYISVKTARTSHVQMEYLPSGVLKVKGRNATVYVPTSNLGSFFELIDEKTNAAEEAEAIQRGPGRPRKDL